MKNSTEKRKPTQGEVYLADVYFHETQQSKLRPVVIVSQDLAIDLDALMAPITSQGPRNQFDVVIEHWVEAGLHRPSVARTSKLFTVRGVLPQFPLFD